MADPFMEAAELVHTCLCAQLAALPDPPNECCLLVGADQEFLASIGQDRCRCGGTGYVRLVGYSPTTIFPTQQEVFTNCAPDQWTLNLELGVVRCPPVGTAQELPTCAEELAFARLVMDDAAAMRRAVLCCLKPSLPAGRQFMLGAWEAIGPQGLCGGGKMTLQLQVVCSVECP